MEFLCYLFYQFIKYRGIARMYRSLFAVCACCLFLASCATASAVSSASPEVSQAKYGAVGADGDPAAAVSSRSSNGTAIPVAFKKIKAEEALTRSSVLETEMDAALAIPDYSAALSAFDSAAELLSHVPQGADRLASLRAKMEKALDLLVVEAVSIPADTIAGTAFKKDFSVRVSLITPAGKKPYASFGCTVFCPSVSDSGEKVTVVENRATGADGTVSFTAPIPAKTGKGTLTIAASISSTDPALGESIKARQAKGQLAVNFTHGVVTAARNSPTVISILDYNLAGKPALSSNVSATMLLQPLVVKGFRRIGMADFPNQLATGDETVLLKAAKAQFGSGVQRFIFGTVRVTSMAKGEDGTWTCTLASDISVWDFTSDTKTYHTSPSQAGTGLSEAAALDAARKKLFGEVLVNDLSYNM